jgi:hypothetical protein
MRAEVLPSVAMNDGLAYRKDRLAVTMQVAAMETHAMIRRTASSST